MPRFIAAMLTIVTALLLTAGLSWFAVRNYRAAAPIAEENLRGMALTTAAILEGVAASEPSLRSLGSVLTSEVAYAAILSADGRILFHTNPDLTASQVEDDRYRPVLEGGTLSEQRIELGTGEQIYEFQAPLHLAGETCILRLALHTWRADQVLGQARLGMEVIFSLLAVGWALGLTVLWLLQRQARQLRLTTRQQELARLGEVGAVLAHEVRNPLAGIKGYGQFLEELLPMGKERGYAGRIVNEAQRLEELVEAILLFTRSAPVAAAPCRPAVVAAAVLPLLAPLAHEQQVEISSAIPSDLMVLCPDEGMRQLLLNLLTNALQASPHQGEVVLSGHADGKWVVISVADHGPGIAPEMAAVLFEPFRTNKSRGAGLGLAVCKKIVDACGGTILAGAAPGGGALFTVRLATAVLAGNGQ